ncbi:hypothetical protein LOK49_LG08G00296 [Camellia lanceoleosa]|uniref:Uncharacterized protein n=1 Tax=Camellia lanceoleosa TaxID=1840588 RepID=A0ACC0GVV4_9ERIC|nr:hypothetical protein LOK49_LG08G00296 [Camellia lanceoleosa]
MVDKYEWYTFDVSDDIRHNQTPPPAKYINYHVPFHDDDESGPVDFKPQVTANMDWILGWAILGLTLYILDDWTGDWRGWSLKNESNRVDRIDLGSPRSKWERVPQMPKPKIATPLQIALSLGQGLMLEKLNRVYCQNKIAD